MTVAYLGSFRKFAIWQCSGAGHYSRFPDLYCHPEPSEKSQMKSTLKKHAGWFADVISDLTGFAAMRVPLQKASRPGEVTLDLIGYRQLNSYACGAVAAAIVVKWLLPQIPFERVHAAVDPCPETGAGTLRVTRALRSLGLRVSRKSCLAFIDICRTIDAGRPVMVCVRTGQTDTNHWVVIYGYGRRPNLVFIAGQGLPFIARQRVKWQDFRKQWTPNGEGFLCWKTGKASPSSRYLNKK